jgi:hypothetical protein
MSTAQNVSESKRDEADAMVSARQLARLMNIFFRVT